MHRYFRDFEVLLRRLARSALLDVGGVYNPYRSYGAERMKFEELKRAINIRETIKLYFVTIGRYSDFIRSYARNKDGSWVNPSLHDSTAAQHEPLIVQCCGNWWGYNPNNPAHPMRKYFNEHYKKEA